MVVAEKVVCTLRVGFSFKSNYLNVWLGKGEVYEMPCLFSLLLFCALGLGYYEVRDKILFPLGMCLTLKLLSQMKYLVFFNCFSSVG